MTVGRRQNAAGRGGRRGQRGGALLAVLWLSAALSAIAFTLAVTVRAELERAGAAMDGARAYYLAQGAIERFILHMGGAQFGDPRVEAEWQFRPGRRRLRYEFPTGVADLEVTGENGKLDLYSAPPETLARLFVVLGVDPARAGQIAGGIVARRSRAPTNLSSESSFSSQLPSFLQLEDLLTVGGMTQEIYYGWWERGPEGATEGRLAERGGVARHLTVLGGGAIDVNYASPAVLQAIGVPDGTVAALLQLRETRALEDAAALTAIGLWTVPLPPGVQLSMGGAGAYTVRATAQLKGRPVRRSVAALVRLGRDRTEPPIGVVRWYQTAN